MTMIKFEFQNPENIETEFDRTKYDHLFKYKRMQFVKEKKDPNRDFIEMDKLLVITRNERVFGNLEYLVEEGNRSRYWILEDEIEPWQ